VSPNHLHRDPIRDGAFIFVNKRRDRMTILVWDRHGFWLLYKRLEAGRFQVPPIEADAVPFRYLNKLKIYHCRDSSLSWWRNHEAEIVEDFMISYVPKARIFRGRRLYIEDSITIAALATMLDLEDYRPPPQPKDTSRFARLRFLHRQAKKGPQNWVHDALTALVEDSYFEALAAHSEEIERRLPQCNEPEKEKLTLLA
jgi:hypothetical protein